MVEFDLKYNLFLEFVFKLVYYIVFCRRFFLLVFFIRDIELFIIFGEREFEKKCWGFLKKENIFLSLVERFKFLIIVN